RGNDRTTFDGRTVPAPPLAGQCARSRRRPASPGISDGRGRPVAGRSIGRGGIPMQVWIDQDCCTGAGLCVDHCPELFVVLDDGIGYVHDGGLVFTDLSHPAVPVPRRYEQAAIDAVERCPGECIYLEPDSPPDAADDEDI